MTLEEQEQWICTTVDVEGGIRPGSSIKPVTRGVAVKKDKRWPAHTQLKVYFFDVVPTSKRLDFIDIARQWLVNGVSLSLDQTNNIDESHIRVKLEKGSNVSRVGTFAGSHPKDWTLKVHDVTPDRVLHEFGHALGLLHEYFHSQRNFAWNEENVYRDYAIHPGWNKSQVDQWVFEKAAEYNKEEITRFDIDSVMVYPMKKEWSTLNRAFPVPSKLSQGDIDTIRKLYPE